MKDGYWEFKIRIGDGIGLFYCVIVCCVVLVFGVLKFLVFGFMLLWLYCGIFCIFCCCCRDRDCCD